MSNTATKNTVRYENRKWVIDVEHKCLHPENDTRTRVDIDEVWDELSQNDQNLVAELLSAVTDIDMENYEEDLYEEED